MTDSYRRLGMPGRRARLPVLRSETTRARALAAVALVAVAVVLVHVASTLTFVIPSPWSTAVAVTENLGDGRYVSALALTARNVALGFAIGMLGGLLLGSALGLSERVRRATEASLMAANAMPVIVVYPLLIPLLTIGSASKVAMGALMVVFPVALIAVGAIRSLPRIYLQLGRALRLPAWRVVVFIVVPAVRSQLVAAARIGFGVATIGVILAEFFAARRGLGLLIRRDYELARYAELMATMTLVGAASFAVAFSLWRLERNLE